MTQIVDTVWSRRVQSRCVVWQRVADKTAYALLLLLSILLPLVYHPFVIDYGQTHSLDLLALVHKGIDAAFMLLVLSSVLMKGRTSQSSSTVLWLLAAMLLSALGASACFGSMAMFMEIRAVLICFFAMLAGWRLNWSDKRLLVLVLVFAASVLEMGLALVFMKGIGFKISRTYFADQKNAVGPMLATAAVLAAGLLRRKRDIKGNLINLVLLALIFLCVLTILTIRSRAALLSLGLVLALLLYQRFKGKYVLLTIVGGILLLGIVVVLLPPFVKDYVHQSFFAGFSGDVTSGRMSRNENAMDIFCQNPLFAHLKNPVAIETVHNFPLYALCEYGLLFAFSLLLVYFYMLIAVVKRIFSTSLPNSAAIGYYAMLVLFVVSMFEYAFPFGPGTSTVMNFVFLGLAFRFSEEKIEKNNDKIISYE